MLDDPTLLGGRKVVAATKVTLGRCCRRSLAIIDSSVQLQSDEAHRPGWIVADSSCSGLAQYAAYRKKVGGFCCPALAPFQKSPRDSVARLPRRPLESPSVARWGPTAL